MVLLPQSSPFYLLVRSRLPFLMSVCQVIKSPRRFKPLSVSFPLELPKPTQSKRSKTRVLNVNQTSLTCEGGGGKAPPLSHPTDTPPTPHPPAHPDPLHSGCNLTGTYIMMEIWEQYSCIANEEQQLGHLFFYPLIIIMKYTKTCCGFFFKQYFNVVCKCFWLSRSCDIWLLEKWIFIWFYSGWINKVNVSVANSVVEHQNICKTVIHQLT